MLDCRGSSPRSTLLEKLVSQFTQNVQFSFVAGVAVLGPSGALVDVTDVRKTSSGRPPTRLIRDDYTRCGHLRPLKPGSGCSGPCGLRTDERRWGDR